MGLSSVEDIYTALSIFHDVVFSLGCQNNRHNSNDTLALENRIPRTGYTRSQVV